VAAIDLHARLPFKVPINLVDTKSLEHYSHVGAFLGTRGQRDGFVLMVAFLATFLFIRTSARMIRAQVSWWPGNVETGGGLHIHHLVWGIVLLLVSGFLGFALRPGSPSSEVLAAVFGIGAGLTLDEFALWLRLEDVYWEQAGRESLDAVVVAALLGGLIVLGLSPVDTSHATPAWSLAIALSLNLILSLVAILKGRLLLGVIGVFIPLVSLVAAVRLAAPHSVWARWFYRSDSRKRSRCEARFAGQRARHARVLNAIGGTPTTVVATEAVAPADERN
jgi:hypothetical protein